MNNRCFVISPIGLEGSDVRKHSDAVFRFIIEPAMNACGLEAVRADHLAQPGKITDQMFHEILNDRLCIAVLTGQNPNVFYELAIAQAADRPVILLMEEGQLPPFDVKDLRAVYYDLWPGPLVDGVYSQRVIDQIRELEAAGWKTKMPFGEGLQPLGGTGDKAFQFFAKSEGYGDSDAWRRLLEDTKEVFEVMGINLGVWRRTKGFGRMLADKAADGCRVRIMLIHQDNPCLRSLINEAAVATGTTYEHVQEEISSVAEFFAGLSNESENIESRQIMTGCPHLQLARTDQVGMYVPYLYSETTNFSPLWRCPADHPLYPMLAQEFESLWQVNAPSSEDGRRDAARLGRAQL